MSWFNLWDGLKTKTCRYLLQRYLGQFFENNLNLEQLKVDLYNGKAVVENISLKVNALNELFEEQGWAFEVISGHIGCLTAMVPWNALMTNDSSLNISDLTITLRPVTRCPSDTTMLESMWSSVSSSMQMAEECMKQIDDDIPFLNHSNTIIGLEKFAETIDNVLNRIHANLTNTTLNIEYTLPKTFKKLIISIKANHVEEIIDNAENPLISFDRKKNCHEGYHTRPEFILSHTSSCFFKQNSNRSSNKVECIFDDCTTDLDISMYDRLSALFGLSPFDKECDAAEIILEASNPMDIHIKCNLLKLHLRFPIVDGRLPLDPKKIPYWKKNIRNDYLSFDFQNILIEWKSFISIAVDEFDGYYCDDTGNYVHIIKCSSHKSLENATPEKE
ncbi:hypothetical protein ACLKA6_001076, partial [Drosophila palustris]